MIIIGAQRKDVGISRSTELPLAADQSAQGRSRRGGRMTAEMTAIRLTLRIPATARTPMNRDRALDPKGLARPLDYRLLKCSFALVVRADAAQQRNRAI